MGCGLGRTFWRRTVGFRLRRQRKYGHKRYQRKHDPSASGRFHFRFPSTAMPMFPQSISKLADAIDAVAPMGVTFGRCFALPYRVRDNLTRFTPFVLLRICNSRSGGRDRRTIQKAFL
jgi:hypothetical protein